MCFTSVASRVYHNSLLRLVSDWFEIKSFAFERQCWRASAFSILFFLPSRGSTAFFRFAMPQPAATPRDGGSGGDSGGAGAATLAAPRAQSGREGARSGAGGHSVTASSGTGTPLGGKRDSTVALGEGNVGSAKRRAASGPPPETREASGKGSGSGSASDLKMDGFVLASLATRWSRVPRTSSLHARFGIVTYIFPQK